MKKADLAYGRVYQVKDSKRSLRVCALIGGQDRYSTKFRVMYLDTNREGWVSPRSFVQCVADSIASYKRAPIVR